MRSEAAPMLRAARKICVDVFFFGGFACCDGIGDVRRALVVGVGVHGRGGWAAVRGSDASPQQAAANSASATGRCRARFP